MKVRYTVDMHNEGTYFETQEGKNLPVLHCVMGTPGFDLCPEVLMLDSKEVTVKSHFGFKHWDKKLEGRTIDEIWMCGFCTDICVMANFQILKAQFPEVPITIIEDACAGVTPELHEAALKVMKSCQAKVVKWSDLEK
jgi:nicotinamidase-related amidase